MKRKQKNQDNVATKIQRSKGDKVFDLCNYILLGFIFIVVFYPLYFVLIASISNPALVNSGQVWILPKDITWSGYEGIFQDKQIISGYINSIVYTVIGVAVNLFCTIPAAYALSRKNLSGRKFLMCAILFTMFFSGGMIPNYLLVNELGLYDSMWALILPGAIVPFNLIIARTFFESTIPAELIEAAKIDGCDDFKTFFRVVLPLSGALIAIMVLFYGVGHWNTYFNAMIYFRDKAKFPLQLVLRNILILNQVSPDMLGDVVQAAKKQEAAALIQYGAIIISALPLLVLYPFVQKYFVKGVMIGAVKG